MDLASTSVLTVAAPDGAETRYVLKPIGCERIPKTPGDTKEQKVIFS